VDSLWIALGRIFQVPSRTPPARGEMVGQHDAATTASLPFCLARKGHPFSVTEFQENQESTESDPVDFPLNSEA